MTVFKEEDTNYLMLCRDIMDSVADSVFTVDLNLSITSYNLSAARMTGVSREEAIGKPCYKVFNSDLCLGGCALREAMVKGKAVLRRGVLLCDGHGNEIQVAISSAVLRDAGGNITGGVGTIRNTKGSSAIMNSVADGVFTVDSQMHIQSFNRSAEEITGFSRQEAIGRHYHKIICSSIATFACPIKEAMDAGGAVMNRGIEIVGRDKQKKQIFLSASALRDGDNLAYGGVGMIHDRSVFYPQKNEFPEKYLFHNMYSRNKSMRGLFDMTEEIAASNATVFLHGESGTGKELFAKAIHELSSRRNGPLVTVSCGALQENLCESEMFGVRKGAFSGVTENRQGQLELCSGGTFVLDEVGDMPLALQGKLLRVLEDKEFKPVGAKLPIKADVRFIIATHRNLEKMVEEGTFSRDLYSRINVVQLKIPPLRERKEDIPLLLDKILKKYNLAYCKNINCISSEVLNSLLKHDFPGNVRELQNLIEQAVIRCKGGEITAEHMPSWLVQGDSTAKSRSRTGKTPSVEELSEVIGRHNGNRNLAAHEFGVDRSTLWRWVKGAVLG